MPFTNPYLVVTVSVGVVSHFPVVGLSVTRYKLSWPLFKAEAPLLGPRFACLIEEADHDNAGPPVSWELNMSISSIDTVEPLPRSPSTPVLPPPLVISPDPPSPPYSTIQLRTDAFPALPK